MEDELDLLDLFNAFWKKKLWLVIAIIAGCVFGFLYTKYIVTPKYNSFITLILSKPTSYGSNSAIADSMGIITQSDITLNQKLISTYGEIMTSRKVANQVIRNLNLDMKYEQLKECVKVTSEKDTDVIKVTITTEDPYMSAAVATEMVSVFTKEVVDIYKIQNVSLIDEAEVDKTPINISYKKNILLFAFIMFALVAVVIFLLYYFDNTIKTEEDITKVVGLPVLATIPYIEAGGNKNV